MEQREARSAEKAEGRDRAEYIRKLDTGLLGERLATARLNQRARLRKIALRRAGYRCERCGERGEFHIHHKTYERFGHELPSDVEVLCLACHGAQHPHHRFRPMQEQKVVAARRAFERRHRAPNQQ